MWVDQRDYQIVGNVLADARAQAGLTQQQLAQQLGKPQSFVSNYERGQRRLDVLELLAVLDVLEAEPRKVFSDILARLRAARVRLQVRR